MFDIEGIDIVLHEILNEVEVVLKGVLGLLDAGAVADVANNGLNNITGPFRRRFQVSSAIL